MTTTKRVLCERRLRRIPAQFSWIDQRLVFEGHLGRCDAHTAALYLLLIIVADAQGLSYWGDARVMRLLSTPMPPACRLLYRQSATKSSPLPTACGTAP